MLSTKPTRMMLMLDRLTGWWLALSVGAMTVVFGVAYSLLSVSFPGQGLVSVRPGERVGFGDALYFSVATETTLGAGEMQALGLSRLLVCMQVILGLASGGVIVAKLTSLQGRELRQLAQHVAGDWIEVCEFPDRRRLFTFATLSNAATTIRYAGENFDANGKALGFFDSVLTDFDTSVLRFRYSNSDSSTAHFSEGVVSLRFVEDHRTTSRVRRWVRYQGTARDFGQPGPVIYEGTRATAEESVVFRGSDLGPRAVVIRQHLALLGPSETQS